MRKSSSHTIAPAKDRKDHGIEDSGGSSLRASRSDAEGYLQP